MGSDTASNMADVVDAAVLQDPAVRDRLLETGGIPRPLVEKVDRRFTKKVVGADGEMAAPMTDSRRRATWSQPGYSACRVRC